MVGGVCLFDNCIQFYDGCFGAFRRFGEDILDKKWDTQNVRVPATIDFLHQYKITGNWNFCHSFIIGFGMKEYYYESVFLLFIDMFPFGFSYTWKPNQESKKNYESGLRIGWRSYVCPKSKVSQMFYSHPIKSLLLNLDVIRVILSNGFVFTFGKDFCFGDSLGFGDFLFNNWRFSFSGTLNIERKTNDGKKMKKRLVV